MRSTPLLVLFALCNVDLSTSAETFDLSKQSVSDFPDRLRLQACDDDFKQMANLFCAAPGKKTPCYKFYFDQPEWKVEGQKREFYPS
uniref:Secreted protein n=1 Tax=Bursaphelenchus xylophilus TaxID=6326 RepID=A0A1I7RXH0_BURXY